MVGGQVASRALAPRWPRGTSIGYRSQSGAAGRAEYMS